METRAIRALHIHSVAVTLSLIRSMAANCFANLGWQFATVDYWAVTAHQYRMWKKHFQVVESRVFVTDPEF